VPLTRFDVDFQKLVNLDTLIPLLNQGGILSPVELRELHVVHRSESWRISYLLSVLDRKGRQGIKALIFALKSTADLAQCPQSADLIVVLVHTEVHMLTPHPEGKDADALRRQLKALTLAPPSGGKVRC